MFSEGDFFLSADGGVSFEKTSTIPTSKIGFNVIMQAAPTLSGEVWISLAGNGGLWKSNNYGKTFSQVSSVSSSLLLCFGKSKPGTSVPAVYLMGTVNGVQSVFVSSDLGSTWEGKSIITFIISKIFFFSKCL